MFWSLMLRSSRAALLLSSGADQFCFWGSYLGMRLEAARELFNSEVLFERDGNEGAGEPADRGCDTQSSERESSHACSISLDMKCAVSKGK